VLACAAAKDGGLMLAHATNEQLGTAEPVGFPAGVRVPGTDPAVTIGSRGEVLLAWSEPRLGVVRVIALDRAGALQDLSPSNVAPAHSAAICLMGGRLLLGWTDREDKGLVRVTIVERVGGADRRRRCSRFGHRRRDQRPSPRDARSRSAGDWRVTASSPRLGPAPSAATRPAQGVECC